MTNTITAGALRLGRHVAQASVLGLMVLTLAGCGTGTIFGGQNLAANQATAQSVRPKVTLAPVIGAPAQISNSLSASVAAAVEKQSLPVAKAPGEPSDYTLRGYVVAAPEKTGTKLSYIWDVTDKDGKRAQRITGEEVVPGKPSKDPWANVNQQVIDGIANKTALQLSALLPSQGGAVGSTQGDSAAPAQAAAGQPAASSAAAATQTSGAAGKQTQTVSLNPPKAGSLTSGQVVPGAQTASLTPAGKATALVPAVSGAPGDGQTSLTQALQRQLAASGISLSNQPGPAAYVVQGKVQMGQPDNGKQAIKIEWQVLDPSGKKVGTVSQNNSVPQGSLDGAWGKTADAAATAAAQGIIKLLPASVKAN